MTATSIQRPFPSHQIGMVTSPGRRPGAGDSPKIPFFSKTGLNCPSLANFSTRSLIRLCRTMRSPVLVQQMAWSPNLSKKVCVQLGQMIPSSKTETPSRRRQAMRKACGRIRASGPSMVEGTAVTHEPAWGWLTLESLCFSRGVVERETS